MDLNINRSRAFRAGLGIVAASALALAGCSKSEDAKFADSGDSTSKGSAAAKADPKLDPVDEDLLVVPAEDDVDKIETTDEVEVGDDSRIVVPSGELKVTDLASVGEVPSSVIENSSSPADAEPSDGGSGDSEDSGYFGDEGTDDEGTESAEPSESGSGDDLRPADGTELKLVTFEYTANDSGEDSGLGDDDDSILSTADVASPTVEVDQDGSAHKLPKLDEDGAYIYLMSLPADADTDLVVEQAQHEQRLDLKTGERAADDVAATYYREQADPVTINEPLAFPTIEAVYDPDDKTDVKVDVDTKLETADLTPWTKDKGWAEPGTAWMVLEADMDFDFSQLAKSSANVTYTLTPDQGDSRTFKVAIDGSGLRKSFVETVAVPVQTQQVEVSGSIKANLGHPNMEMVSKNPHTSKTKQPYTIDFGAAPSSGDDSSESTDAPTGESSEAPTGQPADEESASAEDDA